MTTWLVIVAVGAGSYIFRALPVLLQRRLARTSRFDEIVAPAGTAALAALAAAGLQRGATTTTATAGMAVAAVVALVVAVRGRPMVHVLLAGSLAYAGVFGAAWLVA